MKFKSSKFLHCENGAFLPLFAIGAMVLIPIIGMAVDYSRMLNVKGQLQAAADSAVNAAVADARRGKNPQKVAENFLAANLPDIEFKTRGILKDGRISLQVESDVETPLLAMIGKPKFTVTASTEIPKLKRAKDGSVVITPNQQDIDNMRRQVVKALDKLPPRQREKEMRRFDKMFSQMGRNPSSFSISSN